MMPTLTLVEARVPALRAAIIGPLTRFNEERTGQVEDYRPLAVLLTESGTGEIIGGLDGDTMFGHLHVDLLFVPAPLRQRGLGRQLMACAENEARRRGCRGAWLDTYSFQAREFYERIGYTVFGVIEDFPPGHRRFFLKKALSA